MRTKTQLSSWALFWVLSFGVSFAWAQTVPSAPEAIEPRPNDTIESFSQFVQDRIERGKKVGEETQKAVESTVPKAIAEKPTTIAPPAAFADRVNAAIDDFLPLFQFAVNEITSSEDKMSVTAKFNPLPVGRYGNFSVSTTASQPQVFKALEEQIVEPAREAQRKALLGKVDDFSDLTIAGSYGFQRPAGTWDNTRKLFGRNYEIYRGLASSLLSAALAAPLKALDAAEDDINNTRRNILSDPNTQSILLKAIEEDGLVPAGQKAGREDLEKFFGSIKLSTLEGLSADLHKQLVDVLRRGGELAANMTALVLAAIETNKLDALPAMINNQPQIVFQGSYRASDEIIGQNAWAITASYEMGSRNVNAALREFRQMRREGLTPTALGAYQRGVTEKNYKHEDKFTFSASFRRNLSYNFTHPYTESVTVPGSTTPVDVTRTAVLELPRSDTSSASLSWTRLWPRQRTEKPGTLLSELPMGLPKPPEVTGRQDPRSTLSIEWVNADQTVKLNGKPLENDRFVARLSLVVPVQGGMTLPLTVVYSDKPEFLADQDRILSAHVGISYKIGEKGTTTSGQ